MRLPHLLLVPALLVMTSAASASSLLATTDALGRALVGSAEATSDASSSLKDDKIVLAARDDAASFIASHGRIRGAHLEAALQHVRQQLPELQATDLQLAEALLSQ